MIAGVGGSGGLVVFEADEVVCAFLGHYLMQRLGLAVQGIGGDGGFHELDDGVG